MNATQEVTDERCNNGLCEKARGHADRCTEYAIPEGIARLYHELDAANARRDRGHESHAEQHERWAIEDALAARQA